MYNWTVELDSRIANPGNPNGPDHGRFGRRSGRPVRAVSGSPPPLPAGAGPGRSRRRGGRPGSISCAVPTSATREAAPQSSELDVSGGAQSRIKTAHPEPSSGATRGGTNSHRPRSKPGRTTPEQGPAAAPARGSRCAARERPMVSEFACGRSALSGNRRRFRYFAGRCLLTHRPVARASRPCR